MSVHRDGNTAGFPLDGFDGSDSSTHNQVQHVLCREIFCLIKSILLCTTKIKNPTNCKTSF